MSAALVNVRNVWKEYGEQVVLEQVNAEVAEGEFVTIVGASGCGKTTFLKLLLGTETTSRGQLLLEGAEIPAEPGADRGIVFQRYSVFPHLNTIDNVVLGLELQRSPWLGRLFGRARHLAHQEAEILLEEVGLTGSATKFPHELSGGMQQRLAFAQALIKRPRILLLDEPFGALDPGIRADMHDLVTRLWSEHQLTVFMVTHDIREGFKLGSRLWVFDKLRHDPQVPEAFGARITYDLDLRASHRLPVGLTTAANPLDSYEQGVFAASASAPSIGADASPKKVHG